jgi:DME family drug/metabolite transporter
MSYAGPVMILGAATLWGTVGPAQVAAGSTADPGVIGVLRVLVGGAVLGLFTLRGVRWRSFARAGVLAWIAVGATATGVFQIAFMHAVDTTGAAMATAVVLGLAPVATGLCARWWTGEQITGGWVAGTAAAVAGCVLLLAPWSSGGMSLVGMGLAATSGFCYGVYTVAAKRIASGHAVAAPAAVTFTLLLPGLVLSPMVLARPDGLASASSLALVAWTGIACTAVAYTLFLGGLRTTSATTAGTLSLLEPLVAVGMGVMLLREDLGVSAAAGCAMLLLGLVVVTTAGPRRDSRREVVPPSPRPLPGRTDPRGCTGSRSPA